MWYKPPHKDLSHALLCVRFMGGMNKSCLWFEILSVQHITFSVSKCHWIRVCFVASSIARSLYGSLDFIAGKIDMTQKMGLINIMEDRICKDYAHLAMMQIT